MQAVSNTGRSGVLVLKFDEDDVNTVLMNTDIENDGSLKYAYDNFADAFSENILEYAFAYADIPRNQITKKQREAAQSLLKLHEIEKLRYYLEHDVPEEDWEPAFLRWYEKRGVLGEIVLHMFLKEFKNTIPLISKMYFKDSFSQEAKGFDAVHVSQDSLTLWLGETKFYKAWKTKGVVKGGIINISLNHEDNPQLIFESLNSTGLNLSEGDKIRNYILMGLPNDQQTKFYEKYWNRIESYTDYDVSSFVRDYLSIKQQSTPNMNSVYPTFKKYVEDAEVADIEPLLKDLLEYAKRYAFLIKGGHSDERLNSCIYRLNRLSTSVTRPFLLEVIRLSESGALTADELIEVFHFTESYLFRRAICDLPTNALNKIFLLLHREIIRFDGDESHYVEKFKYALLSKRERTRFPSDEEFAECMSTRNIYGMNPKNKLYLFERLENSETSETKDVWGHLDRGEYSIEHIMPQHLTAAWIVSLGDNYEAIHTNWLHRLANLTLTAYNSRYSNSPFAEKRDMPHGFKDSGLRINQWVGRKEQWGLPELEERDQLLKNTVIGIWPYPTSNYHPQKKQMDAIALDEDVILTGRVLSKYSFKGAEQPVASWADMYQQVITMLHSENKAVLTKLAVSQDPAVDLSLHFSMSPTSFNSCRQIDTDLYVWTGTDTQYKINNLRKIFAIFDVPESELVFYLKDEDNSETVAGNRYEIRKKYWEYTLPQLKNAFSENGLFGNVNPVTSNWIAGFVGIPGIHIDCVANFDESRVELYLGMASKEKNKELFGFLFARKDNIEEVIGTQLIWSRMDDNKASKIHTFLPGVDISKDIDWPRMAKFHVDASKKLYLAFKEHLEQYFHISL